MKNFIRMFAMAIVFAAAPTAYAEDGSESGSDTTSTETSNELFRETPVLSGGTKVEFVRPMAGTVIAVKDENGNVSLHCTAGEVNRGDSGE